MYVIGIAGGSCSGKTTLSAALEEKFASCGFCAKSIHMDKFFKNPTPNVIAPFTGIEYPEHNHPDSFKLEEFCSAIDDGIAGGGDVLIVEGLLVLALAEIREKLDLKIFIDLPSDERLIRRVKRFMRDRGQTLDEVASRYLDTVRYRHSEFVEPSRWYADMLFNGCSDVLKSSAIITSYVQGEIK